jgi:hypothetical protein
MVAGEPAAAQVNAAIGEFVSLFGLTQSTLPAMHQKYGAATSALVEKICRSVADYPVDWSAETYDEAVATVGRRLLQTYPFLSDDSVRQLKSYFAYSWK